nr:DUF6118 family protein [Fulvimarina endophytica]
MAEADDAAEAFAMLTREIREMEAQLTVIRKGTEAAFDKLDSLETPPDYTADIARLSERVSELTEMIDAIAETPAIQNGPEHYARMFERSGENLVRTATHALENRTQDLERLTRNLDRRFASERARSVQNQWLGVAAFAGFAAGVLLTLLLPVVFPV